MFHGIFPSITLLYGWNSILSPLDYSRRGSNPSNHGTVLVALEIIERKIHRKSESKNVLQDKGNTEHPEQRMGKEEKGGKGEWRETN